MNMRRGFNPAAMGGIPMQVPDLSQQQQPPATFSPEQFLELSYQAQIQMAVNVRLNALDRVLNSYAGSTTHTTEDIIIRAKAFEEFLFPLEEQADAAT